VDAWSGIKNATVSAVAVVANMAATSAEAMESEVVLVMCISFELD
jgi:hypothetical protein